MKVEIEKVLAVVADFITESRGDCPSLERSTRLLQDGLVDSFGLVELTARLEQALGIAIPAGALIPEDFETPGSLVDRLNEALA